MRGKGLAKVGGTRSHADVLRMDKLMMRWIGSRGEPPNNCGFTAFRRHLKQPKVSTSGAARRTRRHGGNFGRARALPVEVEREELPRPFETEIAA